MIAYPNRYLRKASTLIVTITKAMPAEHKKTNAFSMKSLEFLCPPGVFEPYLSLSGKVGADLSFSFPALISGSVLTAYGGTLPISLFRPVVY